MKMKLPGRARTAEDEQTRAEHLRHDSVHKAAHHAAHVFRRGRSVASFAACSAAFSTANNCLASALRLSASGVPPCTCRIASNASGPMRQLMLTTRTPLLRMRTTASR